MVKPNSTIGSYYAILKATLASSEPERFIIGYRTEQSLNEFLVASCIVATGYTSREEAVRDCEVDTSPIAA